jgi:hypothetical protein
MLSGYRIQRGFQCIVSFHLLLSIVLPNQSEEVDSSGIAFVPQGWRWPTTVLYSAR